MKFNTLETCAVVLYVK